MGSEFLTPAFLSPYMSKRPRNAGRLFDVVYLRTYSRWQEDKGRRERWWETCARVVNYSISLYQGPASAEALINEAERMFDAMFNLEVLPAGRTMWVGGTDAAKKFAESQFNCAFLVIDGLKKFHEMFHMLLCGSGVGFRVMKSDVAKVEKLRENVMLEHDDYTPVFSSCREQGTLSNYILDENDVLTCMITVGDSKEAWVDALRSYLHEMSYGDAQKIKINYDNVRPKGERIKTFGGRAAGHEGLKEMFTQVHSVIRRCGGAMGPIDALDICCIIALNVVVGGTRRSSLIALGDPDDQEFLNAKLGLWSDPAKRSVAWRVMSNNSIVYDTGHKPTKAELENIFGNIMHNGEPGFFNLGAAKLRRPNVCGINPCAEILLDDRGVCNLSTVVLSSFLKEDRSGFDLVRLTEAMKLAVRIGMRQTNVELSVPEWSEVQKRDRLTGVSLTGVMDSLDALEWNAAMSESLFALLADVANMEATEFASEMRIPRPLLVTAIKPEGTLSQLPTVSSGMHRAFAPYFIRRIRVSANDPVCHALKYLGVPNEPDASKPDRIVFSFPVKSATPIAAAEESALSQLSRYYMLQENYTDHNSSCTLTFAEDEVPGLIDEIHANWDKTIAIALLPKTPGIYPQMPYEAIPAKAYYEMMNSFPNIDGLAELVDKFERGEMEDELEADPACGTGQCPIR